MDWTAVRAAAEAALDPVAWNYFEGIAGDPGGARRESAAWNRFNLVPRYLRGLTTVDTSIELAGRDLRTPILIAPTAAHGLADPAGEPATAAAAGSCGALMIYSNMATVEVTEFGRAATGPWWAQVYLMRDRDLTRDFLARAAQAGASAVVFTVDYGGPIGDAPFRAGTNRRMTAVPGNYSGRTWAEMTSGIEHTTTLAEVEWLARESGLPVWLKGIVHPGDAAAAAAAGVAGIIVSTHGHRTLGPIIPTALALSPVVRAVAGRIPVLVDGGVRSGADVFRALALGASAVGIGRPVLWALAAGGRQGVAEAVQGLTAELRYTMATCGAATLAEITADLISPDQG